MPNVSRTTEIRHFQFNANYWKTFVHARLATTPGDRGCLTLYGNPRTGKGRRTFLGLAYMYLSVFQSCTYPFFSLRREALVEADVRRDAAGVGQVAWRQDDAVRRAAVGGDPQATGSGIREPTPTRNHRDHRFTNLQQNWDLTSWQRGLGRKRLLAVREFALGVEALERFVRAEPLRRVHECVFGVLASESEAVDPRL